MEMRPDRNWHRPKLSLWARLVHRCTDFEMLHPMFYRDEIVVEFCVVCEKPKCNGVYGEHGLLPTGYDKRTWRRVFG